MTQDNETEFASPERSDSEKLHFQNRLFESRKMVADALDVFPEIVLILNRNRQVIYCNKKLREFLELGLNDVIGKRPGEIFNCIHAFEKRSGCGTTAFCSECGAVKSILLAQKGEENSKECRITVKKGDREEALDLRVWSVPSKIDEEEFTIFTVVDISSEKRKQSLERTFFHDVLNEGTVLLAYLQLMLDGCEPLSPDTVRELDDVAKRIVGVIQEQRDLLAAERGSLRASVSKFEVGPFLKKLADGYAKSPFAGEKNILLEGNFENAILETDEVIFGRVIGNLIKNALEATEAGETVTVGFRQGDGGKTFYVHNPAVMPKEVQLQMFQRSFSTKGEGRGIGTYSIKFFTENYLKGRVRFVSEEGKGTTFFISIPS